MFPFYRFFGPFKHYIAVHKQRAILFYLYRRYAGILDSFANDNVDTDLTIEPDSNIWVSWWDGEETMPPLVKACYKSILKHAGTHPVLLITKYNFKNFVSIPEYIMEKVNSGLMTVTHFSNILRANLLYDYGGIWMDATILVLKDISLDNFTFFTLKAPEINGVGASISRFAGLSSGISDKSKRFHNHTEPQISRWSGFLLAGTMQSPVFAYLRNILYAYWKDHNNQIDYLLFDYTIALGYDNIPVMKKLIDNVPCSEVEKFVLEKNMNCVFTEENFSQYPLTTFHKLTWKKKFDTHTKDNKLTIYGHLLDTLQ